MGAQFGSGQGVYSYKVGSTPVSKIIWLFPGISWSICSGYPSSIVSVKTEGSSRKLYWTCGYSQILFWPDGGGIHAYTRVIWVLRSLRYTSCHVHHITPFILFSLQAARDGLVANMNEEWYTRLWSKTVDVISTDSATTSDIVFIYFDSPADGKKYARAHHTWIFSMRE